MTKLTRPDRPRVRREAGTRADAPLSGRPAAEPPVDLLRPRAREVDGDEHRASVGAGMDGRLNSFLRIELNRDEIKAGPHLFTRFRPYVNLQASPNRLINNLSIEVYAGDEIDFDNARLGKGTTLTGTVTLHPNDHLELAPNASWRRIQIDDPALGSGRLFLAQVERLKTTWSFTSRAFVRLVGQYVETRRDPALYTFAVDARDSQFNGSALVGYKLNWQTVLYIGYGDERTYWTTSARLEPSGRQAFAKVSYAIQT